MIRALYLPVVPEKVVPCKMKPVCKAVLIGTAVIAASAVVYLAYTSYCDCEKKKKQVGETCAQGVPKSSGPPSTYLAPNIEAQPNDKQNSTSAAAPDPTASVSLAPPQ